MLGAPFVSSQFWAPTWRWEQVLLQKTSYDLSIILQPYSPTTVSAFNLLRTRYEYHHVLALKKHVYIPALSGMSSYADSVQVEKNDRNDKSDPDVSVNWTQLASLARWWNLSLIVHGKSAIHRARHRSPRHSSRDFNKLTSKYVKSSFLVVRWPWLGMTCLSLGHCYPCQCLQRSIKEILDP